MALGSASPPPNSLRLGRKGGSEEGGSPLKYWRCEGAFDFVRLPVVVRLASVYVL